MSIKNLILGFFLFTLFASMLLFFAINFGAEYGLETDEIGGGAFNLTAFENEANTLHENASTQRESFEEGGEGFTLVDNAVGVWSIFKNIFGMIFTPYTLLSQILYNIFGIPIILTNVISAILSIIIILGIWRAYKLGY